MGKEGDRPCVARGNVLRVTCAICSNGSCPAREFIDALPPHEKPRLVALFQRMADAGRINNRQHFKKVEGPIWEFKGYQVRVLCFQDGLEWVLTHGFIKKQDRISPSELDRANRIKAEDAERTRKAVRPHE